MRRRIARSTRMRRVGTPDKSDRGSIEAMARRADPRATTVMRWHEVVHTRHLLRACHSDRYVCHGQRRPIRHRALLLPVAHTGIASLWLVRSAFQIRTVLLLSSPSSSSYCHHDQRQWPQRHRQAMVSQIPVAESTPRTRMSVRPGNRSAESSEQRMTSAITMHDRWRCHWLTHTLLSGVHSRSGSLFVDRTRAQHQVRHR
jgi:hypothetical protein